MSDVFADVEPLSLFLEVFSARPLVISSEWVRVRTLFFPVYALTAFYNQHSLTRTHTRAHTRTHSHTRSPTGQ